MIVNEKCQSCMGKQCAWIWETRDTYLVAPREERYVYVSPFFVARVQLQNLALDDTPGV